MLTVGHPTAAPAPQMQVSVVRKAGTPPINTVELPAVNALDVGWCPLGGNEQICISPTTAAGCPPIITVLTPGPIMVPPWVDVSPTLTAAGIPFSLGLKYFL